MFANNKTIVDTHRILILYFGKCIMEKSGKKWDFAQNIWKNLVIQSKHNFFGESGKGGGSRAPFPSKM